MKLSERECFRQGTTTKPASGTEPQGNGTHALGVSAEPHRLGEGGVLTDLVQLAVVDRIAGTTGHEL